MKDEVPFQDFPAYERQTRKKPKAFVLLLITALMVASVVGGLFFLGQGKKSDSKVSVTPTQSPTSAPTLEPTESASATVTPTKKVTPASQRGEPTAKPTPKVAQGASSRSDLNVSVLNGSGVAGAGQKIADYLSGLGYVIGSTGNADSFGYEGITVKVKKDKSSYAALLKKDLDSQASGSAVVTSVDDTISADAEVIVGK